MAEMKQAEKMAKVREDALALLNLPEDAVQVGTATFILQTTNGFAKVVVSAIKDTDFDPEFEKSEWEAEKALSATKAEKRKMEADAKKAASLAKKAAKKG